MGRTRSKCGKIWLYSLIWRSGPIIPKNNKDLNQGLLHLCSKFGDSSLNQWWVIVRTSPWLIHTHGHTDTQTQATTIPKGQNWPRVKMTTALQTIFPNPIPWKKIDAFWLEFQCIGLIISRRYASIFYIYVHVYILYCFWLLPLPHPVASYTFLL